jgi:hypothetical protein
LQSLRLPWPPHAPIRYAIDLYNLDPRLWPPPWNLEHPAAERYPPKLVNIWGMMLARYGREMGYEGRWNDPEVRGLYGIVGMYLRVLGLPFS